MVDEDAIKNQRNLMGQSVEWMKLPYGIDSLGASSLLSNKNSVTTRTKAHKDANISYRPMANLYSSIMGKPTHNKKSRSIYASTMDASSQNPIAVRNSVEVKGKSGIPQFNLTAAATSTYRESTNDSLIRQ